ncbi:Phytosulfokine receptor 1 like [Actinidia chinensis var. chinensis]|uniref:non-specific serine/threonine protein kinase n=1 Tax=Actinidia chinensis var. chinensis TaxID=1590841 RepID=A0A2R6RE63_ACTCC|nr:Phytosulfokine receptor 1 like [Actinidia chinensis var. chinensis]
MGVLDFWVVFVFLGLSLQSQVLNSQNLSCNSNDLKALEDFLSELGSGINGWDTNSSSSSPNCCNWPGITCDSPAAGGRVVKLELSRQRLTGKISQSLSGLDQLKTLNLSFNFLRSPLPQSLLNFPNLEVLDLSNNNLFSSIPGDINLPSLQILDISDNSLTGSVPMGVWNNLTRIRFVDMGFNYFSGSIPPGIGNCSSLEHLCLASNDLIGPIPENLFRLPKLGHLSLPENRLSGELSDGIGNLSNLVHLDISANWFFGAIPDVFHRFAKLKDFSAESNNFTGQIPHSLSNSRTITLLSLRNNSLHSPIGLNCLAMTSLVSLDLATNQFTGPVPDNLPSCPQLKNINLAKNYFTGQIPESFRNFQSLTSLSLSNSSISNLSDALGILQNCQNLTTLVLTLNFHSEALPSNPSLGFKNLKALVIANCGLTGVIPQWLHGLTQLQLLDLSLNRLGGTIPPWLGNFDSLFYLDLSHNSFTGVIPKNLTGLQSLIFRNVSFQNPSLDFPFFMKRNLSAGGLQYNQIWSFPPTLDLSYNNLSGPIWPELGNFKKLHVLDLKFNNLSGSIPSNLSGMTSMENLDLSHNNLSGTIPPSLVSLSFLSRFNVAYNQLHGVIPVGGQFPTFPNSSFEGNPGLCGEHASPCPSSDKQTPQVSPRKSKRRRKGVIIGMAVGIGFGTTFLLALMFLIILRASSRQEVDPEKEDQDDANGKEFEELGSRLVVLFRNKDNNKELTLDDLLKSTNDFDQENIIGCGGFGLVYRATLPDGRKVAIKRLCGEYGQMEREFQAEVEALSRAQHPNLVLLQGYCNYRNDRLLIYSYMENGSLDYWLHEKLDGPSSLDWDRRLQIAQGAVRGLAYLHQSCEPHILHRDIKSSNILLDENFEAHLADFGLARLILSPYDTHVTTDLVGTLGYIPPEYGQASVATYKGDVYSFGVVLLELLTGKRPMDMCKAKENRDLISWVLRMRREKLETQVFDPFIYDKQKSKEMLRVLEIACRCLCDCPKLRPSTLQLVSWLDNVDCNV